MAEEGNIIIKKIKKGGHGHHGGAWKVAYADFVTAMMAFFLLLWLLATSSKATKDGIAEYFTPTIGLKDSMGIGFKGGESPTEEGKTKSRLSPMGIVSGAPEQGPVPDKPEQKAPVEGNQDAQLFEKAQEDIKRAFEEDPNMREMSDNIVVEQSPEGLKIELLDLDKKPMFEPGKAVLTPFGEKMAKKIADVIITMPNYVSLTGHTDASGTPAGDYTNWELSADRANATRRFFLTTKLEPQRIGKVVGMADRDPLVPEDPNSARNRRVTVIMLRGSHMDLPLRFRPAARELLTVPKVSDRKALPLPVAPPKPEKPKPQSSVLPDVIDVRPGSDKPAAPAAPLATGSNKVSIMPGVQKAVPAKPAIQLQLSPGR